MISLISPLSCNCSQTEKTWNENGLIMFMRTATWIPSRCSLCTFNDNPFHRPGIIPRHHTPNWKAQWPWETDQQADFTIQLHIQLPIVLGKTLLQRPGHISVTVYWWFIKLYQCSEWNNREKQRVRNSMHRTWKSSKMCIDEDCSLRSVPQGPCQVMKSMVIQCTVRTLSSFVCTWA